MHVGKLQPRETACLGLGLVLGVLAALAFRSPPAANSFLPKPTPDIPAHARTAAKSPGQPDDANGPRSRQDGGGLRNLSDWERVAAEYQTASISLAEARGVLYQLDARALRKLAASAATWEHGLRTSRAVRDIFHRWAEVDPLAALAQAQTLDPSLAENAVYEAMNGFVEGNPVQAAAYFARLPSDADQGQLHNLGDRRLMTSLALEGWAEQDGQGAINFLNQLPAGTLCAGPAWGLAAEWARQDPAAALAWAAQQPEGNQRTYALQGVISTWTESDPQTAANYALSLSGNPSQADLVEAFARQWATQDLPAAANWVGGQSSEVQAKAAAAVAACWSSSDPAAAAAWANQLSGAGRDAAYNAIAGNWCGFDPAAAQGWLAELPAGDARDAAVDGYLTDWHNADPPARKIALADTINDAAKRNDAVIKILNGWLSDAPQSAQQWISQTSLPASITGKLKGG